MNTATPSVDVFMDPAIRVLWTTALRSGQYPQTTGLLCRTGDQRSFQCTCPSCVKRTAGYCCLGVLCELAVAAGIVERSNVDDETAPHAAYGIGGDWSARALPSAVMRWAGLSSDDPAVVLPDGSSETLSCCNDVNRMTFLAIADVIDAQP